MRSETQTVMRIYATKPPTITNGNAIFNGNTHTTYVLEVPKGYTTTYPSAVSWLYLTSSKVMSKINVENALIGPDGRDP